MAQRYEFVPPNNAKWFPDQPVCPQRHTSKVDGAWLRGDADIFELVITANGVRQFKTKCQRCGQPGGPIPHVVAAQWVQWFGIDQTRINDRREYEPCVVSGCTADGNERHHFAPRNTFGDDADLWPVLPLCQPHHRQWHQTMDGYRWHRKRAS